jgi:hypothetical protein
MKKVVVYSFVLFYSVHSTNVKKKRKKKDNSNRISKCFKSRLEIKHFQLIGSKDSEPFSSTETIS